MSDHSFFALFKRATKRGTKRAITLLLFQKEQQKERLIALLLFQKEWQKERSLFGSFKKSKNERFSKSLIFAKKNWLLIFKMSECPTLLYFCFFQKSDTMSDCSFSFCSISLSLIVLLKWAKMRMSDWANERLSNPVNKTKHRQYKTFGQFLINLLNLIFFLLKFIQ